ncbi:MAG: cation-translocating P-type ATPase [Planctomycetota bacterium]
MNHDPERHCEDECAAPAPSTGAPSAGAGVRYQVRGMDCAEEIGALREALSDVVSPDELSFDVLAGVMEVPGRIDTEVVVAAVATTGMHAQPIGAGGPPPATWWEAHGRSVLAALSGAGVALGFALHASLTSLSEAVGSEGLAEGGHVVPWPAITAYGIAVIAGLLLVLPKAWRSLLSVRPDMNLLMTLAVAGAIGLGEWFEAAAVSFLFALSLALEAWSVGRARRAVETLLALAPPKVRVRRGGELVEVDPASVSVGTVFNVRPGERFGLDGVVVDGRTEVDQAPITGESRLVFKEPGSEVYAGTINGNGSVDVKATKTAADTTLAQIVRMVGEARKDRSDSEQWVERFARIYTPIVFALAAAVWIGPPLLFDANWSEWFYRALVLLVIGCPCALVIATPVAVVSGLAAAARNGVLVKGGRFLEVPASIKVVALDKTGTLTEGHPRVVEVIPHDDHTPEQLLAAAAAVEQHSDHPLARAIVAHAREQAIEIPAVEGVTIIPGKGALGTVDGREYWLGSHRWLEERGQEEPGVHEVLEQHASASRSVVVVGRDDHVCGFLTLADAVRADAKASVAALKAAGVTGVSMLTGDNAETAKAVAAEVRITDVRAELLPADKVEAVVALEREFGPIAMIGDGVNDAPALARASIGVAMGAMGTDVAVETADVALMTDDLSKLAWLVGHSQRTLSVIQQNTVFALAIKAVFVVLTFAGLASLWAAIAADMGASLLVVFNALRLLNDRADPPGPE